MNNLIGKCKTCLGCNKLKDPNFRRMYRCNYATSERSNNDKGRNNQRLENRSY